MQPAKPSFLEYFEQKEKESNHHAESPNADNRKFPAEVDVEVVSHMFAKNMSSCIREQPQADHSVYQDSRTSPGLKFSKPASTHLDNDGTSFEDTCIITSP